MFGFSPFSARPISDISTKSSVTASETIAANGTVNTAPSFYAPQATALGSILDTINPAPSIFVAGNNTFSRPSPATYVDAGGNLVQVGQDVLRIVNGLPFIEAAATNTVHDNADNSTWQMNASSTGITVTQVGQSTLNGFPCFDYRYQGTSGGTWIVSLFDDWNTSPVVAGLPYVESVYVALVAGSAANIPLFGVDLRWGSGLADTFFTLTNTLTRYSSTGIAPSGFTTATPGFVMQGFVAGTVIDITLRFSCPQLEQGSTASSVILTSGTPQTRQADVGIFVADTDIIHAQYAGTTSATVAVSDNDATSVLFAAGSTETGNTSDLISGQNISTQITSETGSLNTSSTILPSSFFGNIFEVGSISDVPNTTISIWSATATETGTLNTSSIIAASNLTATVAESGSLSDVASQQNSTFTASTPEVGSLSSQANATNSTFVTTVAESGTLTDNLIGGNVTSTIIAESGSLIATAATTASSFIVSTTETGSLSGQAVVTASFPTAVSETNSVSILSAITVSTWAATVNETVTGTDTSSLTNSVWATVVPENMSVNETVIGISGDFAQVAEVIAINDTSSTTSSTFTASVSDTGTLIDTTNTTIIAVPAVSETGTASDTTSPTVSIYSVIATGAASASDTPSTTASIFNASSAELGTALDTVSPAGSTFNSTITETASASDLPVARAVWATSVSETGSVSDLSSGNAIFVATASETGSLSDTTSTVIITAVTASETYSMFDLLNITNSVFNVNVLETGAITDQISETATDAGVINESGSLSDVASQQSSVFVTTIIETGSLAAQAAATFITATSVIETNSLIDSNTAAASTFVASVIQTGSLSDAASQQGSIFVTTVSEAGSLSDSLGLVSTFLAPVIETNSLTDTTSVTVSAFVAAISETGTLADQVNETTIFVASLSENLTSTDAVQVIQQTTLNIPEALAVSETTNETASVFTASVIGDALSIADFTNGLTGNFAQTAEVLAINDATTVIASIFTTAVTETGAAAGTPSGTFVTATTISESISAADTPSVAGSVFLATTTEAGTSSDTVSAAASTYRPSVSESNAVNDTMDAVINGSLLSISEALNGTDQATPLGSRFATTNTEAAAGADQVSVGVVFANIIIETGSLSETVSVIQQAPLTVSEIGSLTDQVDELNSTFITTTADVLAVLDHVNGINGNVAEIIENGTIQDDVATLNLISVTVTETLTATAQSLGEITFSLTAHETANTSDIVSVSTLPSAAISETLSVSDQSSIITNLNVSASSTLAASVITDGVKGSLFGVNIILGINENAGTSGSNFVATSSQVLSVIPTVDTRSTYRPAITEAGSLNTTSDIVGIISHFIVAETMNISTTQDLISDLTKNASESVSTNTAVSATITSYHGVALTLAISDHENVTQIINSAPTSETMNVSDQISGEVVTHFSVSTTLPRPTMHSVVTYGEGMIAHVTLPRPTAHMTMNDGEQITITVASLPTIRIHSTMKLGVPILINATLPRPVVHATFESNTFKLSVQATLPRPTAKSFIYIDEESTDFIERRITTPVHTTRLFKVNTG